MKIKKIKNRMNFSPFVLGGTFSLVLLLVFGLSVNKVQAQTFSELSPAAQQSLIQAFENQMELLRQEALDPQPGVSTESNKNIFYYYENVLKTFQNENVTLRNAFINELFYLQKGPVGNHKLTRAIFYRSIDDAPAADRSDLFPGSSSQTIAQNSGANSGSDSAYLSLFFQTRENFRSLIDNMNVSSSDMSALEAMFMYIRNNK